MTETTEPAKRGPKPKPKGKLAYTLHKINGVDSGTFVGLSTRDYGDLKGLNAIRDLDEGEAALVDKARDSVVIISTDEDD